ncbi:MAG: synthase [Ilumatobacteraceae bacterium]|nr:synthase [Ilumatobacteraceae bacterium]
MGRAHDHRMNAPTDLSAPPRLALVGDRSSTVRAHERIPTIVAALGGGVDGAPLEPIDTYWLHSTSIDEETDLAGFDGIWVIPGSPYEHTAGVLHAVTTARERGIPFLGTCGGFQHMLLEFARNVAGLTAVEHGETDPHAEELLLVALECSLLGEEADITVAPGTRAAAIMGAGDRTERYFCRFGLNDAYLPALEAHGLVVSGRDPNGEARIAELPTHPFFLGTLFQPELASDSTWVHPILRAFGSAVRNHAGSGQSGIGTGMGMGMVNAWTSN